MNHEGENNVHNIPLVEIRLREYEDFVLRLTEIAKYLVEILELDILHTSQPSSSEENSLEALGNRIKRSALRNGIKDHMNKLEFFALYDKMTQEHGVDLIDAFISQLILSTLFKKNLSDSIISKVKLSQINVLRDFTFKEQFR